MNSLNHLLCPQTRAGLEKLVEPLASYIAAGSQQHVALFAAITLLLDNVQQINEAANFQIATFDDNHIV
jgi:hypothetical protein